MLRHLADRRFTGWPLVLAKELYRTVTNMPGLHFGAKALIAAVAKMVMLGKHLAGKEEDIVAEIAEMVILEITLIGFGASLAIDTGLVFPEDTSHAELCEVSLNKIGYPKGV